MRALSLLARAYPALTLVLLLMGPLTVMLVLSVFEGSGRFGFIPSFTLENYQTFFQSLYFKLTWRSIWITGLGAALVMGAIYPALLIITNLNRRWQVFWIMVLLSLLCLSEVVIGYAWVLFLLKSTGLPGWLEALGLWAEAESLTQNIVAIELGLFTLGVSIAGLLMYPQIAARDGALEEAARTLGARPLTVFFTVILPLHVQTLVSTFVALYVYLLGAYSVVRLLGTKTDHQTLVWRIFDLSSSYHGKPTAAALAAILLVITALMLTVPYVINRLRSAG